MPDIHCGQTDVFGLIKPYTDAHTLGLSAVADLLEDCGYRVYSADNTIATAAENMESPLAFAQVCDWVRRHGITRLGISYRLDPDQATTIFEHFVVRLTAEKLLDTGTGGTIKSLYFAGLPDACRRIERVFQRRFPVFMGDETPLQTLRLLGIPEEKIPQAIQTTAEYDNERMDFGNDLLGSEAHLAQQPPSPLNYPEMGSPNDHLILRLTHAAKAGRLPLFRAHVGPYQSNRLEAVKRLIDWVRQLAKAGWLDIASIGSSQLTQSAFGESWAGRINGGGTPIHDEREFATIWKAAQPMLVRAYSGSKHVVEMAKILERSLHNAWHALSLWWFSEIDGRGPNSVKQNLDEHLAAIRYIARCGRPFEPNVPHHFAFRGADDVTYLVSSYLAARTAKKAGVGYLVLQNMLNLPKASSGLNDLAKARALLSLVGSLADSSFHIIYQPRAGLDYFSPDLDKAKIQLAATTALMTDVEPDNPSSPPILHVVSYSEGDQLATPKVINESVRIAKAALTHYPTLRNRLGLRDLISGETVTERREQLLSEAHEILHDIERRIPDPYSAAGLYRIFEEGYLPVPNLWNCRETFPHAVDWNSRLINGGTELVNERGQPLDVAARLDRLARMREHDGSFDKDTCAT